MEKYFRYTYYILIGSALLFAVATVWLFLMNGEFAKGSFEIINKEPYSIHIVISAKSNDDDRVLFQGSVKQGETKKFEKFVYDTGVLTVKLNKEFDFSIGEFTEQNDFSRQIIIRDNRVFFEGK